jgi:LysR family cys regulon transcriptional activator
MGMGVGVIAPMALHSDDLTDLNAISAIELFPTVTTWLGFPRDRVLRGYMKDFIGLFAPHWPDHMIEQAVKAESQSIVDALAETLDLPTRSCI